MSAFRRLRVLFGVERARGSTSGIEEVKRRIRDTHPGSVCTWSLRRQPALGHEALNVGDRAELPGTMILGVAVGAAKLVFDR